MHMRNTPAAFAAPPPPATLAGALAASTGTNLPDRLDYLVVGGGATGMAFCDTLLHHATTDISVAVIDEHSRPGGQWLDSYDFVRLHQPSDMYGVESAKLEPSSAAAAANADGGEAHRATRLEILDYYSEVCRDLEEKFDFRFLGETSIDAAQLDLLDDEATAATKSSSSSGKQEEDVIPAEHRRYELSGGRSVWARKVVDGRYLQPDLPVRVPPKFRFDPNAVRCVPVNSLADEGNEKEHYVIIGAGKTGMDAITFLLTQQNVDPENILWVVPNEAWITARENIGSCMEFLHECTSGLEKDHSLNKEGRRAFIQSNEFFQRGFLEWERQGKVYRFDKDILPTKFKDATLSRSELGLIAKVKRVIRNGRVKSIEDDGTLHFGDGTIVSLPWPSPGDTLFVHCSAGAFNYSDRTREPPPVFSRHLVSIQDVYGTPGFCFVGSVVGRLEGLGAKLSDAEKNSMCLAPSPDAGQAELPLGPSGGDIGAISSDHGLVQRLSNLKKWLEVPEIQEWLVGHRLFNLRHCSAEDIDVLVKETWDFLGEFGVIGSDEK